MQEGMLDFSLLKHLFTQLQFSSTEKLLTPVQDLEDAVGD